MSMIPSARIAAPAMPKHNCCSVLAVPRPAL